MYLSLSLSLSVSLYLSLSLSSSFFGQVMSPHHPDQLSQGSQVSRVTLLLCFSKGVSLSQWVTRSPIELSAGQLKSYNNFVQAAQFFGATKLYLPDDTAGSELFKYSWSNKSEFCTVVLLFLFILASIRIGLKLNCKSSKKAVALVEW